MRRRLPHKRIGWFVVTLVTLATVIVFALFLPQKIQRRRVEAAIAQFEANPSKWTVNELRLLLAKGVPTNEQGTRILHLISRPTILARSAYPTDRVPTISVEWPFRFQSWSWSDARLSYSTLKAYVQLKGQEKPTEDSVYAGMLSYQPMVLRCGTRPLPVGTHRGQVHIDWSLTHSESHSSVWTRLKSFLGNHHLVGRTSDRMRLYDVHFEIPVEIAVVEAADAEQVALISDPALEEAVRQSFTRFHHDRYPLEGEPRPVAYKGMFCLKWKNAPIALAFEPVLRLPDGHEVLHPSRLVAGVGRFRTRAGNSDHFHCAPFLNQFPVTVPGQYEGTILLRTDPNIAYDDPAIKAIWGGTLEFPISFSVYEEPPGR